MEVELLPPNTRLEDLSETLQGNAKILVEALERVRSRLNGVPLVVNTYHYVTDRPRIGAGYRDQDLNKKVGGVYNSLHREFLAADVYSPKATLMGIKLAAKQEGFTEILVYLKKGFVHLGLEHLSVNQMTGNLKDI